MLEQLLTRHFLAQMSETVRPLVQIRLVDLENISGEYHLGAVPRPGNDGLDLMRRQVLSLIDDEKRLPQAASADVSQRRNEEFFFFYKRFDMLPFATARTELCLDDVQVIHQRLKEWTHLIFLVSRKKANILITKYYRRTRQDNLVEIALLLQCRCQCQESLAGSSAASERNQRNLPVQARIQREFLLQL